MPIFPYFMCKNTAKREFLFIIPACSLLYAKVMQTRTKKACFRFVERSLLSAKLHKNIRVMVFFSIFILYPLLSNGT